MRIEPTSFALPSMVTSSRRWKVAGLHLAISCMVAALGACVIFLWWFPSPLGTIAGGTGLFVLMMSVDVIAGPALTFVAASPQKPRAELRRDLAMIAAFQIAALGYGIHAVSLARPVLVAFEVDRFRVVSAVEIDPAELAKAPAELRDLSWTGPRQIAAVKPTDPDQLLRSIELGMVGIDLSMDPRNWRSYESESVAVWQAAKPLQRVLDKHPSSRSAASRIGADAGQPLEALRYLPLQSRRESWIAVLAQPSARVVGYLPFDGFF